MELKITMLVITLAIFLNLSEGRVISAPRQESLSMAEDNPHYFYQNIDGHSGTYSFGYDISDPGSDNIQFRKEERYPNGTVVGSYGYVDAEGRPYRFSYIADQKGYRVFQDLPRKPSRTSSSLHDKNIPTESSITWTRPTKKSNKMGNQHSNSKTVNKINNFERLNDPKNYLNSYYNNGRY